MSVNSEAGDQMDYLRLKKNLMLRNGILSFNRVEGESVHELRRQFKALVHQHPAHDIPERGFIQLPYAKAAHLLDHMAKTIKKKEKDQGMATLLEQLDDLAQKVNDLEVLSKGKYKYIPPHKHQKTKEKQGYKIEEVLLLILHKVDKHDRLLEEIRENVMMLNQMTASHSLLIQLLGSKMDQLIPLPNSDPTKGWPYENEATPNTEI
uniref:Uncharacterized protein n=1 Tax=Solanum tuberosum TaxID=4113 RepID=M1DHL6_SOLTU